MQNLTTQKLTQLLLALFSATSVLPVHAQGLPDAGSLLQQNRQPPPPPPPRPEVDSQTEPTVLTDLPGPAIDVRGFRFEGRTLLTESELQATVKPFLRSGVKFAELQNATAEVGRAYRAAGWVVRAYLPKQDVTEGVVTIRIVEARFGGVKIEAGTGVRLKLNIAAAFIEAAQAQGQPLNADALERGLLILNEQPGIKATGSLQEGEQAGDTVLALKLSDEPLAKLQMSVDNHGSRSTGAHRALVSGVLNNTLGMADQLTVQGVGSQGSAYIRGAWTMPVGASGLRVGANASLMNYKLVGTEYTELQAEGHSETVGLEATYPLVRSRQRSLTLSANADHKQFNNLALSETTSRYKSRSLSLGASGHQFDSLLRGGVTSAQLSLAGGQLDLSGSPNQAADTLTTQTAGKFAKVRGSLSRQQGLTDALSASATLSGQWAPKNLDSSEKFFLGGPQGVRAYPSGEAGGTDGVMVTLALKWQLPEGFTVSGLYDWGKVRQNHNNRFAGAPQLNSYSLQGAGLSVGWQSDYGLALNATLARRIGHNPNKTETGQDQDGSLDIHRLWLDAQLSF